MDIGNAAKNFNSFHSFLAKPTSATYFYSSSMPLRAEIYFNYWPSAKNDDAI
jgi:hypothetical protein